jgi:ParB-like chromosome segregation protein Spo0J
MASKKAKAVARLGPRDKATEAGWPAADVKLRPTQSLTPRANNPREHDARQIEQIAASIRQWGFTMPVLVDEAGEVIAGHARLAAAQLLKLPRVPVMVARGWSADQCRAYVIADNQLALTSTWSDELLAKEFGALAASAFDMGLLGFDDADLARYMADPADQVPTVALADRFLVPPFSVLDARQGWWRARRRAWVALGIQSEIGRAGNLLGLSDAARAKATYDQRKGAKVDPDDVLTGTSVFDPVICEIAYRWFAPIDGVVLDPFAGGSVRGIVAAKLGRGYLGVDLRAEQVAANRVQAEKITPDAPRPPHWIEGDSRDLATLAGGKKFDFVFSCPPYANLERYSDDPRDLSTLDDYGSFIEQYRAIVAASCGHLKNHRFAVFVVGDVRDKDGNYQNFVGDTVEAFRAAGLGYYGEAILVTAIGSLAMRSGKTFATSRKLGKGHQNVLIFVKGDWRKAVAACGTVDVVLPEGLEPAPEDEEAA